MSLQQRAHRVLPAAGQTPDTATGSTGDARRLSGHSGVQQSQFLQTEGRRKMTSNGAWQLPQGSSVSGFQRANVAQTQGFD